MRGKKFTTTILQWGPIPPSGGPRRAQYLDSSGKQSLKTAWNEFDEAVNLLNVDRKSLPEMDFSLVSIDQHKRLRIQKQKRSEWDKLRAKAGRKLLQQIEPHARSAVSAAVEALNFLEDHGLAESAHRAIHETSFLLRGLYGCPLVLRDGDIWSSCPLWISHIRIGTSAGLISDFECTVCERLAEDCDHQSGIIYAKIADRKENGDCNICSSSACEHEYGQSYPIIASATARNVISEEMSLVTRPRYPQSRFQELTIDPRQFANQSFIFKAAAANNLNCDQCLGPCEGYDDTRGWFSNRPNPQWDEDEALSLRITTIDLG